MIIGLAVLTVIIVLVYVAVQDLRYAKIRNEMILLLVGQWFVLSALTGFAHLGGDLAAGGILFVLGFAAWMMRVMGAGDAKLLLAGGLLMGLPGLLPFSVLLIGTTILSVLLFSLVRIAPFGLPPAMAARLDVIVSTRRIPAAVPIAIALGGTLLLRYGIISL